MNTFNLPDLGEGLPDAEIHEWFVKVGDEVEVDQVLASMETAKAVVDVPSPFKGKITKLFGEPGDTIDTGEPLIGFEGEANLAPKKAKAATVVGNIEEGSDEISDSAMGITPSQTNQNQTIQVLPSARLLAKQHNIDLSKINGTGPNGVITINDIKDYIKNNLNQTTPTKSILNNPEKLTGVRKQMALTMAQSHAQVVPVTLMDDANISQWSGKQDITFRLIRAVCTACEVEPSLNAWYDNLSREVYTDVNLGLALDSEHGLFVPVIKQAQNLDPKAIREKINIYKSQVKDRTIPQEDLLNPTITLSNFGMFAGKYGNPIVVTPMVAIIGVGGMRDDILAINNQPTVQKIIPLSLTFDHRAVTGGEATRFLVAMMEDLSNQK